jgi:hypothetical protein
MKDLKTVGQNITELAANPNDHIERTIRLCPYVQAFLEANNPKSDSNNIGLDDWIDNQDVMQALHISPRTLQTLRSNGTLPYSRINYKIYYRRQDVERLLNDNYSKKGGL